MYTLIVSYMFCSVMSQSGLLGIINNNYADQLTAFVTSNTSGLTLTQTSATSSTALLLQQTCCVRMFQHAHLFTVCYMNSSVFTWYILHI